MYFVITIVVSCIFHVPRKSGRVRGVLIKVTRGPENLDHLYFYSPRKSGNLLFKRGPENLEYFHVSSKSGSLVFIRMVQKIWTTEPNQ